MARGTVKGSSMFEVYGARAKGNPFWYSVTADTELIMQSHKAEFMVKIMETALSHRSLNCADSRFDTAYCIGRWFAHLVCLVAPSSNCNERRAHFNKRNPANELFLLAQ